MAGEHDLRRFVVVGDLTDVTLGRGRRNLDRHIHADTEQRRHRPLSDRDRLLHRLAAKLQQTRGIGERERAGSCERRIFSERVPGDERHLIPEREALLGLENAHDGHGYRHQRRLSVFGKGERLLGPVPHDLGEVLRQRRVDFLEHRAGRGKRFGERLAHADVLAALPWKYESPCHACTSSNPMASLVHAGLVSVKIRPGQRRRMHRIWDS